jgi:glucose/arabinose dehydrogenase
MRCWRARSRFWIALSLGAAACSNDSTGPGPAQAVILAPVDSGYDFPLFVTAPPGDASRLFIVERGGRIRLRKNGVLQDSAFLNLSALTNPSTGEYGLYSLAFHPDYATNRRLFVYYADLNGNSQLAEYQADPSFDHADPASATLILNQTQLGPNVLYGGLVTFGPDGKLYLGLGDALEGGTTSLSQDSTDLRGKLLRIDVDGTPPYSVPADNPYVNRSGWRPEIWQLGLRNPWRWSFDRKTGEVWIGDVGEHLWEEIDYLPAAAAGGGGNNFGWPIAEGNHCFTPATGCDTTGLVGPVLEYPHSPACSVIGGYVYRGRRSPGLDGVYFYGDYCGGWVRSLRRSGNTVVDALPPVQAPLVNDNVVSFGEDAGGEVYVVMASGRIYRIEAVP